MLAVGLALALLVPLLIAIMVAAEFGGIARLKGYSKGKYFFYSFFLGPVGWMMVAALPAKSSGGQAEARAPVFSYTAEPPPPLYSEVLSEDRETLLAKRAAADAMLRREANLSPEQRRSLQNLIQAVDRKLGRQT